LAPLRRPPQAIVNPTGIDEILSIVSTAPEILEGFMSPKNNLALQELLGQSRRLAHDGNIKLTALLAQYRKYSSFNNRTIPSIGLLPVSETEEKNLKELKYNAQNLFNTLHDHQKLEYLLSTKDMISCLQKIHRYSEGNIIEALSIVDSLLKAQKNQQSTSAFLHLQTVKESIKNKHHEILTTDSKKTESFMETFVKKISEFDARNWDDVLYG
jgi:hypothetical protein